MNKSSLFPIGEIADIFHLSVSSLRHYEKTGLLKPEYVDPSSGYRYYSVRQFEALNTIRYLRALDMPLSEISDFLKDRDVERIEEKLRRQKEAVAARKRELERIERKIDNRLSQLRDAQTTALDTVRELRLPSCRMIRMEDPFRIHGCLDMEAPIQKLAQTQPEAVVFLGKVGVSISPEDLLSGHFDQYDGIFLLLDEEDRFQGETLLLSQTSAVSIRFRGSHTEAPRQYRKLLSYIQENNLRISGFSREITMIDYGFTSDTGKFVTEISIPVQDTF